MGIYGLLLLFYLHRALHLFRAGRIKRLDDRWLLMTLKFVNILCHVTCTDQSVSGLRTGILIEGFTVRCARLRLAPIRRRGIKVERALETMFPLPSGVMFTVICTTGWSTA
jgi:hypothetical protein